MRCDFSSHGSADSSLDGIDIETKHYLITVSAPDFHPPNTVRGTLINPLSMTTSFILWIHRTKLTSRESFSPHGVSAHQKQILLLIHLPHRHSFHSLSFHSSSALPHSLSYLDRHLHNPFSVYLSAVGSAITTAQHILLASSCAP